MANKDEVDDRVLEAINVLTKQLESLNSELEREFDRDQTTEQLIRSIQDQSNENKNLLNELRNQLHDLENKIAEERGRDSRRDPKLQKLPDRNQLETMLEKKVNRKTLYIIGGMVSFFSAMMGTGTTILITLYTYGAF